MPRRAGKDITAFNLMLRAALKTVGVYYYVFPTYAQAKKCVWDSITNTGERFVDYILPDLVVSKNSQEMKITLKNDSLIQLVGSDNIDSLVGTNPRGVVFSEYALQSPLAYQFLRPILLANNGWALFISTPRGKNHMWELYNIASNSEDWYVYKLSVDDTQHIPIEEIEKERREGLMSDDLIEQEYYCSFNAGVEGAYYSKYMNKMRLNGQIGVVPWEPTFLVHTAWDLGVNDPTAIIFFQISGQVVRIIDCYQKSDEGLAHFVNYIKSKDYTYGKHFAPHDIQVREWGTALTRYEQAKRMGLKFTPIIQKKEPLIPLEDGIECVRASLSKIWIDEVKCKELIRSLENYRQEYDQKRKVYKPKPLHNWASHFADAMRYLCISLPKTRDGMTSEDIERNYRKAVYGTDMELPEFFRDQTRKY